MLNQINYDIQLLVLQAVQGTPAEKQDTLAAVSRVCKRLLGTSRIVLYAGPHLRSAISSALFTRTIRSKDCDALIEKTRRLYYYPSITRKAADDSFELCTIQYTNRDNLIVDKVTKVDSPNASWLDAACATLATLVHIRSLHIATPSYQDLAILFGERLSFTQLQTLAIYSASPTSGQSHCGLIFRACSNMPLVRFKTLETEVPVNEELEFRQMDDEKMDALIGSGPASSSTIRTLSISRPVWSVFGTMGESAAIPASVRALHIEMAACLEDHVCRALERVADQLELFQVTIMSYPLDSNHPVPRISTLLSCMSNLQSLRITSDHLAADQLECLPATLRHLFIGACILDSSREKNVAGPAQFAALINKPEFPALKTFAYEPNLGLLHCMKVDCAQDANVSWAWAYLVLYEYMDEQKRLQASCRSKSIFLMSTVNRQLNSIQTQLIDAHITNETPEAYIEWMDKFMGGIDLGHESDADSKSDPLVLAYRALTRHGRR